MLVHALSEISFAPQLIIFGDPSGEEEDTGGGDSLSARGLCVIGLLRCPCRGQWTYWFLRFFSQLFFQFICP